MKADQIIKFIEDLAPPGAAWSDDNVGLQVGDLNTEVKNIFLALDFNENVFREAVKKDCNFIFTHHPFLFKPIKKIEFSQDQKSQLIKDLIKHEITLYSAHTNLDFVKGGVSFKLAEKLNLKNVSILQNQKSNQIKIVVFVPEQNAQSLADAMFDAGGGIIGEYSNCSFSVSGKGSFEGSDFSNPAIGEKGKLEIVDEVRLEVIVDEWNKSKVISALIKEHPYEEPAFDVYRLENTNPNYGSGAIGELEVALNTKDFFELVKKSLGAKNFRYAKGKSKKIKSVAVCGGSGSFEMNTAIKKGADAFITADVKYHTFQDAENKIWLLDAGHYETEVHSLDLVKSKLETTLKNAKSEINIYKYKGTTNPVKFFIN
ncbi:MAG: Nif3-like dinuclear metal center hexameric protein [Melioribacteraceae bacterium]|nr:Nif3-like dinuclear metal center hexameric protein [Melioribacteraceae bacterium]MCF8262938.1 Nif3-like dinuclear metal center hexameric protein [Melioribacteraceae bacterium]MCF8413117.1 Nif3-like dinuclear metal center hexameric protein [Melioribacteraceae bacterium]